MATFKEQVAQDIELVFLNFDEFAEPHYIEGSEILVIIDNEALEKRNQELGVSEADLLFFAKSADLPPMKTPGSFLNIDNKECLVESWAEEMGISKIILRQNRAI